MHATQVSLKKSKNSSSNFSKTNTYTYVAIVWDPHQNILLKTYREDPTKGSNGKLPIVMQVEFLK